MSNTQRHASAGYFAAARLAATERAAQAPAVRPNTAPDWSHTAITPLSPSGGFSPVRLTTNNGTFSTPYSGFTEAVAVGDHLTYKIKVAPGATPGGVRVNYLASGATTSVAYCVDLTAANPVWNNIAAGTTTVEESTPEGRWNVIVSVDSTAGAGSSATYPTSVELSS